MYRKVLKTSTARRTSAINDASKATWSFGVRCTAECFVDPQFGFARSGSAFFVEWEPKGLRDLVRQASVLRVLLRVSRLQIACQALLKQRPERFQESLRCTRSAYAVRVHPIWKCDRYGN